MSFARSRTLLAIHDPNARIAEGFFGFAASGAAAGEAGIIGGATAGACGVITGCWN